MERSGSLSEVEVIAVAAAAAAALGGIVIALGRGQQSASRQQSALAAVSSAVDQGRVDTEQVRRSAEKAADEIGRRLPEADDVKRQLAKRARETKKRVEKPARKELRRTATQASRKLQSVESRTPSRQEAGSLVRDVVGVLAANLRQYAEQAVARTESVGEQTRAVAQDAAGTTSQRTGDIQIDLGTRLRENVLPVLQAAAATTSQRTGEALESVRERADTAVDARSSEDGRASRAVAQVNETSQHVVAGTSQAAKDTAATLAWLTLASAIVYFAMMSPERREKVKSALCGGLEQVRLLALDFKGYDPEM